MGIYDRDYMRESQQSERRLGGWARRFLRWVLIGGVGVLALLGLLMIFAILFVGDEQSPDYAEVNFPLNANTATREQLSQIPHLRQDVIDGIIASRPFDSFDEIDRVYGVGPKTFDGLKPYLFVTNTNPIASPRPQ